MATVLKANGARKPSSGSAIRPIEFNLTNLESQSEELLAEVKRQASVAVEAAKQEAAKIRQRAEQEGKAAATAAMETTIQARLEERVQTMLPALQSVVSQLTDARHAWEQHWQNTVIDLASHIAAKVIQRELTSQPEITLDLLREALSLAGRDARTDIYFHPDDLEHVGEQAAAVVAEVSKLSDARLQADPELSRGGCRVTTEFGTIDMSITAQLGRIAEELKQ